MVAGRAALERVVDGTRIEKAGEGFLERELVGLERHSHRAQRPGKGTRKIARLCQIFQNYAEWLIDLPCGYTANYGVAANGRVAALGSCLFRGS